MPLILGDFDLSAPLNPVAVGGDRQALVTFTPPVYQQGLPITRYVVTSSPGSISGLGSSSTVTVPGLTNGVTYTFTVTAYNVLGPGPVSSASNSVFVATVPSAPTAVLATLSLNTTTGTVSFTAPSDTGGSPITGYQVSSSPSGISGSGAASPITVAGLTYGTAYTFTVQAINAIGTGIASTASNSVTPVTLSAAPTAVSAVATGLTTATVTFTAPNFTGGSTITSYLVSSVPVGVSTTGTASPITISGLTYSSSTAIAFTVAAINSVGTGTTSTVSNDTNWGSRTFHSPTQSANWTAPPGVTSVSVVVVGAGGAGSPTTCTPAWLGYSYFVSTATVYAEAGHSGNVAGTGGAGGGFGYNHTYTGGGGAGGHGYAGGGGAGGYSGNGGCGRAQSGTAATSGAGGGGGGGTSNGTVCGAQGGGGVGIFGQGSNGAAGGGGGSSGGAGNYRGAAGGNASCSLTSGGPSLYGSNIQGGGGGWGGGGGANYCSHNNAGGGGGLGYINNYPVTPGSVYALLVAPGAQGSYSAVRIVWPGSGRQFPSTNVSGT